MQCGYGLPPSTMGQENPERKNKYEPDMKINTTPTTFILRTLIRGILLQLHTTIPTSNKIGDTYLLHFTLNTTPPPSRKPFPNHAAAVAMASLGK